MTRNPKIKILFRHRSMEMGGVEKVILSMLQNLDKNKFEITLLLNLNQGELLNEIPKDITYKYIAEGKENFSKIKLINKLQLAKRKLRLDNFAKNPSLSQEILGENFDVEIAPTYSAFASVLNSANKKSKKIGWFHSDVSVAGMRPLIPLILEQIPQFDYFIWGSKIIKDIFVEKYPSVKLPPNEVILNAIPIQEIKKKSLEFQPNFNPKLPVFVNVARLHSRKGQNILLEAHAKLLKDGYPHKILVIGDGEEFQNLKTRAKELRVEESFSLLGSLLNPYPYIKNANFFILPSESEGWPLVIADSIILQKPIIATNTGGIPEMITHHETGFLCEYSEKSIYEAMKTFLTDQELVLKIENNLKDSVKFFDNQKIFNSVEKIILNITQDADLQNYTENK